jgi:hypothetical protein
MLHPDCKKDPSIPRKPLKDENGEEVGADLHSLPLTRLIGNLRWYERDYLKSLDCKLTPEQRADLCKAAAIDMAGADLHQTHLEGANLFGANLENVDLSGAHLDHLTDLTDVKLGKPHLLNVRWGNANISVVDWKKVDQLGEEQEACAWLQDENRKHDYKSGEELFLEAVRSNRQLSTTLEEQGLTEAAARYAYRAQRLQRRVLMLQARQVRGTDRVQMWGSYLFSKYLDILAGYGYKPGRTAVAYIGTILVFFLLYAVIGHLGSTHVSWPGALVLSVTAFHGRGFFPGMSNPNPAVPNPDLLDMGLIRLSALEAVIGLFIEISFIATFTQRFFGR